MISRPKRFIVGLLASTKGLRAIVSAFLAVSVVLGAILAADGAPSGPSSRRPGEAKVVFPVTPELFIDRFRASEGITFNGEGRLFIGANRAIWLAQPDGSVRKIADVHLHLGMAGIGPRDILAADFGPTNVFRDGPNDDGIVWRVTPEGHKTVAASGIADPNFVLVLHDGTFLALSQWHGSFVGR
jgi:hypothetical protein